MKSFFLVICFYTSSLTGALTLYNDSPFFLVARVVAANGTIIAESEVEPRKRIYLEDQIGFTDPVGESNKDFPSPDSSLTPYQVFWYCREGGIYSACVDAGVGSTVTPNTCPGTHGCSP